MNDQKDLNTRPLAQVEDLAQLIDRYHIFSDDILRRWMEVVKGPHREAMEAVLEQRRREKN